MAASSSLRIRALMPLPTCPAWRRPPSSFTATINDPRSLWVPCPGSQPTTTISCSRRSLIFSQSRLRRFGWYGLSRRLATIPSSPFSAAACVKSTPSPTTCEA